MLGKSGVEQRWGRVLQRSVASGLLLSDLLLDLLDLGFVLSEVVWH